MRRIRSFIRSFPPHLFSPPHQIARRITEAMGGTLLVHSEGLNKGSEFQMTLPWRPVNNVYTSPTLKESAMSEMVVLPQIEKRSSVVTAGSFHSALSAHHGGPASPAGHWPGSAASGPSAPSRPSEAPSVSVSRVASVGFLGGGVSPGGSAGAFLPRGVSSGKGFAYPGLPAGSGEAGLDGQPSPRIWADGTPPQPPPPLPPPLPQPLLYGGPAVAAAAASSPGPVAARSSARLPPPHRVVSMPDVVRARPPGSESALSQADSLQVQQQRDRTLFPCTLCMHLCFRGLNSSLTRACASVCVRVSPFPLALQTDMMRRTLEEDEDDDNDKSLAMRLGSNRAPAVAQGAGSAPWASPSAEASGRRVSISTIPAAAAAGASERPFHLLVAEDDRLSQLLIRRILEKARPTRTPPRAPL